VRSERLSASSSGWQWEELTIKEFAMTLHLPFVLSPYPPLGMDQAGQ